jgi:hypothetical protein
MQAVRVDEILRISTQDFPLNKVKQLLKLTRDGYGTINGLTINYVEDGDQRIIILTDDTNDVAAFAGFISRINGRVWQAKNLQTYGKFVGRKLGANIYKHVKHAFKKSIQSDIEQSRSAEILWTKSLPSVGLSPKIFDSETEYIIDQTNANAYKNAIEKMYTSDDTDPEKFRYTWILEHSDHYPPQNILKENQLLLPYTGFWYTFNKEKP